MSMEGGKLVKTKIDGRDDNQSQYKKFIAKPPVTTPAINCVTKARCLGDFGHHGEGDLVVKCDIVEKDPKVQSTVLSDLPKVNQYQLWDKDDISDAKKLIGF